MPSEKPSTDRRRSSRRQSDRAEHSLAEQLVSHTLDPLAVVMLTRDRIQETLEEAVQRGRVTRSDANDLAGELVRRGRQQTEELLVEIERVRERLESGGKRSRLTEGVGRLARTAERARRSVTGGDGFPISDYGELTARQVQSRLGDLDESELRQVREHERRHANRKTVLDAIERALN
jgi:polyhydroxyalkanoate synthesis regulator phasin